MDLQTVIERMAECLEYIDAHPPAAGSNSRTGGIYQPGLQPIWETAVTRLLDEAWEALHPGERPYHDYEISYPHPVTRAKLDLAFCTEDADDCNEAEPEWGIELKRLQFVGDNGKKNDHQVAKVLSPYLKDRGMLHDAIRLKEYGWSKRIAIIGYGFNYDNNSLLLTSVRHTEPRAIQTLNRMREHIRQEPLHLRPLVEIADAILGLRGLSKGGRVETEFEAWAHPAGGRGIVFGWEVRRPEREPDFDPRHLW